MKRRVYLETTIPSYLTAWRSQDLIVAANQLATARWWDEVRPRYEVFVSDVVIQEAKEGNQEAASRRLEAIAGIPELPLTEEAEKLAGLLLTHAALPQKARIDALHIAIATLNGMDFLLTWNCTHIANATTLHVTEAVCRAAGFEPPVICTPPQLMEEADEA
jgi:hypothetical protein